MCKKNKHWCIQTLAALLIFLILSACVTIYIDPFFHYHKPVRGLEYPIDNQRYVNNGILKHFDYNAIITGTSMSANFAATEFDDIWNSKSVKVPFFGASYKEINDNLVYAFKANTNIKYVLRGLDYSYLLQEKDVMRYEDSFYPWYLYDNNIFNDMEYILNKSVFFQNDLEVLKYTKNGNTTTSFDAYTNWTSEAVFGKHVVLKSYVRPPQQQMKAPTKNLRRQVRASIKQNVSNLAQKYPDTKFYIFFTPYSILYWDSLIRTGRFDQHLEAERIAIEELLKQENIEVYSFSNDFELTANLENYKDIAHYNEHINSRILTDIYNNNYQLTKENYLQYLKDIRTFYQSYNYEKIFE